MSFHWKSSKAMVAMVAMGYWWNVQLIQNGQYRLQNGQRQHSHSMAASRNSTVLYIGIISSVCNYIYKYIHRYDVGNLFSLLTINWVNPQTSQQFFSNAFFPDFKGKRGNSSGTASPAFRSHLTMRFLVHLQRSMLMTGPLMEYTYEIILYIILYIYIHVLRIHMYI